MAFEAISHAPTRVVTGLKRIVYQRNVKYKRQVCPQCVARIFSRDFVPWFSNNCLERREVDEELAGAEEVAPARHSIVYRSGIIRHSWIFLVRNESQSFPFRELLL